MMIHAYQEIYLERVMSNLGEAFDYAINDCEIDGDSFVKIFTISNVAKRIENGEPVVITGKTGIELVRECFFETTGKVLIKEPQEHFYRSQEYWCGWAVAYYQWFSTRSFSDIFKVLSFDELLRMYPTLHEADITKFVDIVDKRIKETLIDTNLKRFRITYGCTQNELAKRSGVGLRSIQMYEQRNKDINKASAESLFAISKVLGCTIEDLIEK